LAVEGYGLVASPDVLFLCKKQSSLASPSGLEKGGNALINTFGTDRWPVFSSR
jgi:hypothetical protein